MYNISETLDRIKKSGLFKMEQLGVIEFAFYQLEISTDNLKLIINPNIPSDYMEIYIRLMIKGIDVTKYIMNQWQLKDIQPKDLEKTIIAENKDKIDINKATVTEEVIDIKSAIVTEEKPKIKKLKTRN